MRLQEDIDFTTLSWVKAELDATFKQARQALEAYVEDPEDTSQMRFCANYLHQVQGTLRMVELYGAAMAVEEMEKVALAILDNKVANKDDSYGVLMRGMLQLPDYLERLQSGHKDIPVVLLPLLNDLRGLTGEQQLGEQVLFAPDLSLPLPADIAGPPRPAPVLEIGLIAERLRTGFQQALLKWFKGDQPEHALHRMGAILERLAELTYEEPARKLWWVAAGLIDAVSKASTPPDSGLKLLFGKIEREIKRLATAGEISFRVEPPRELTRSLLYQIATHPGTSPRVDSIRAAFHLAELLPSTQEVEHAVGSISGHNRALLDTVSSAIKEDLLRVKDSLDMHLRNADAKATALDSNLEVLDRVADTLSMLGLAVARRVVAEQREALGEIVTGTRPADEGALLDIAGALLYVEGTLDDQVEMLGSQGPETGDQVLPQAEGRRVVEAVAREAGFNLQKVKDDFVAFIESPWDHERLRSVAPQLDQVVGALRILDLEDAAQLVVGLARFTERELLAARRVPTAEQMDRVADSLASIEYFLEATREHRGGRDRILEVAREGLRWLGYWPLTAEMLQSPAPSDAVVESAEVEQAAPRHFVVEPEQQQVEAPAPAQAEADAESSQQPAEEVAATGETAPADGALMGFQVVPSDDIDDEIREVFIEEVQEEIEGLATLFPEWCEKVDDLERLKPIRRSFHTLKGSGRLVGARALGEFSWKVENMLNRVLDKTIEPHEGVVALIEQALNALPSMLAALEGKGRPGSVIPEIMDVADRLSSGEMAWVSAAAAQAPAIAEPTPEATPEPTPEPIEASEPEVAQAPIEPEIEAIEMAGDDLESEQTQVEDSATTQEFPAVELPSDDEGAAVEPELEDLEAAYAPEEEITLASDDSLELEAISDDQPAESEPEESPTAEDLTPAATEDEPASIDVERESLWGEDEAEEIELAGIERDEIAFAESTDDADGLTETDRLIAEMAARFAEEDADAPARTAAEAKPSATDEDEPSEAESPAAEVQDEQPEAVEIEDFSEPEDTYEASEEDDKVFEAPIAIDPVLFDILRSEVSGHLEVMTDYLDACRAAGESVPATEALQRATHTMNGAFAMVDVPMIGAVVSPLEGYVKRLRAADKVPDARGIEALADSVTLISAVMMSVEYNEPMPDTRPLAAVLRDLRDELPAPQTPHGLLTPFEDSEDDLLVDLPDEPMHAVSMPPAELTLPDVAEAGSVEARISGTDEERRLAELQEQTDVEDDTAEPAGAETHAAETPATSDDAMEGEAIEDLSGSEPSDAEIEIEIESADELSFTAAEEFELASDAMQDAPTGEIEDEAETVADEEPAEAEAPAAAAPVEADDHDLPAEREIEQIDDETAAVDESRFESAEVADEAADEAAIETEADGAALVEASDEDTIELISDEADLAEARDEDEIELISDDADLDAEVATEAAAADERPAEPGFSAPISAGLELAPGEPDSLPPLIDPADPEGDLDMPDLDPDLLEVFVQEASEILDNSDRLMASLRESPNDRDIVIGLQRELHTLKGGARMAGLNPIGDLGHAMESLFEAVAEGRRRLGRVSIETLEAAFDRLHAQVTRVESGQAISLAEGTLARLEGLVRGDLVVPTAAPAATPEAVEAEPAAAEEAAPAPPVPRFVPIAEMSEEEEEAAPRVQSQEYIRVRADLLDSLVNYAGEVAIYRGRLEQQVGAFRFNLVELEQTVDRLREQLRKLEMETEAQILSRFQREAESDETFDPLELDRFSTLQQLSRALAESVSDLVSLQNILDDNTRQSETLLLQQSRVSSDLQEGLMRTRMVPFESLVPRLRRLVRQTAGELGKKAQLKVEGAQGEMDRNVLERMIPPLEHMLRNALAHGVESPAERSASGKPEEGTIRIRIGRESTEVVIHVADDGKGIDRDAIRRKAMERGLLKADAQLSDRDLFGFILESGFSTAAEVSQIAGRGVGMDVVASEIKQLGGSLHIESERGKGTDFVVRLPFTLAVTQAVLVKMGDTSFAVPISSVQGVARISHVELEKRVAEGTPTITYGGEEYVIHDLSAMLDLPVSRAVDEPQLPLLLSRTGDQRSAVRVDAVLGSKEIVVKPVGPQISSVPGIFGATIMGDGSVVVILDMAPLVRRASALRETMDAALAPIARAPEPEVARQRLVMVVDDSITMRKVTGRTLERNDYEVMTAKDGLDAVEKLQDRIPDVMLLDIEMPRMDGYELATYMRNDPRLKNIPIIMITSRTGEKHRQRAFEIGVDRYLGKPYQESELLRNVEEMMQEGRE